MNLTEFIKHFAEQFDDEPISNFAPPVFRVATP